MLPPQGQLPYHVHPLSLDGEVKPMVRGNPEWDTPRLVELVPSEKSVVPTELPAGIIAKEWLDKYSKELTWAELVKWLGEAG
jgi:hypothetical protein